MIQNVFVQSVFISSVSGCIVHVSCRIQRFVQIAVSPIGPGLILLKFNIIVKKFEEFFLAQRKWYDSIIL